MFFSQLFRESHYIAFIYSAKYFSRIQIFHEFHPEISSIKFQEFQFHPKISSDVIQKIIYIISQYRIL